MTTRISRRSASVPSLSSLKPSALPFALWVLLGVHPACAQLAIHAKTLHTMGPQGTITDAVVVCNNGKIAAIGPAASTPIPAGMKTLSADVVTPGLIDAHSTVGLSGIYNQRHDSDQLETSSAIQPELRALDAYNPREKLIEWVRSFGVTTIHTGHAPGELISGQTIVVKTIGDTVELALIKEPGAVACTIGPDAERQGSPPGTRGKEMAMLREAFIKAREYQERRDRAEQKAKDEASKKDADRKDARPDEPSHDAGDPNDPKEKEKRLGQERNLRHEILVRVLKGQVPLMVTANRAQDIDTALRLREEFPGIKLWLDGAAESYLLIDRLKPVVESGAVQIIIHPPMARAYGQMENASHETAAKLVSAGIPVSLQAGYEGYVPKTRVILLEAGILATRGLTFQQALATITTQPARLLGLDSRLGSIEAGKDADLALYDGDPFEYTSHCVGTVINGQVVFEGRR